MDTWALFPRKGVVESNSPKVIAWVSSSLVGPWRFYFLPNKIKVLPHSIQMELKHVVGWPIERETIRPSKGWINQVLFLFLFLFFSILWNCLCFCWVECFQTFYANLLDCLHLLLFSLLNKIYWYTQKKKQKGLRNYSDIPFSIVKIFSFSMHQQLQNLKNIIPYPTTKHAIQSKLPHIWNCTSSSVKFPPY